MAGHRRIRSPQGTGANGSVEVAARLAELVDVTITSAVAGDYLRHNGTAWVDVAASQLVTDINALLDHGTLAGLSDDDHTQYALLAGRSGGQTLIGSTAASQHLVLQSTSHATEGEVQIKNSEYLRVYDPDNGTNILIGHAGSGGAGRIITSEGVLSIETNGAGAVWVTDSTITNYLILKHDGTDGVIATNSGDLRLNPNSTFVGINTDPSSWNLRVLGTTTSVLRLDTSASNASGVTIRIAQTSTTPADADAPAIIDIYALDDTAASRNIGRIAVLFDDVTSTTLDSSMAFSTMDNVNAAGYNKTATLTSLGVWTDASSEEGKAFEGVIPDVLGKLKLLDVQKYRSANVSGAKVANAERHCSPSAENFWDVFRLGVDPRQVHEDQDGNEFKRAGIAPKDLAGVALLGLREADAKIVALEQRVAALEGAA